MGRVKNYFTDGEWFIAIKKHEDTPVEEQKTMEVMLLNNTWRYWCADPFVFERNGMTYVFMELFDKIKQKGLIGYRVIDENGKISAIHSCLDMEKHMSYPFIFEKNGQVYMIPECYQSNQLTVYRAESFPDNWVKDSVLLNDIKVCDTNIIERDGNQYFTTMKIYGMPFRYDQLLLYYEDNGSWIECSCNPVVRGADCARNGGAYFYDHGRLIRPAQNCADSYGENLSFREIKELSQNGYKEEEIGQLYIENIVVKNSKRTFDGIHTYNTNGKYDVVDLRISNSFQIAHFISFVIGKIKRILRK